MNGGRSKGSGFGARIITLTDLHNMQKEEERKFAEGPNGPGGGIGRINGGISGESHTSAILGAGSDTNTRIMTTQGIDLLAFKRIGAECVRLTNIYRMKKGLAPVQWNEELAVIGHGHSKDMGEGKVCWWICSSDYCYCCFRE